MDRNQCCAKTSLFVRTEGSNYISSEEVVSELFSSPESIAIRESSRVLHPKHSGWHRESATVRGSRREVEPIFTWRGNGRGRDGTRNRVSKARLRRLLSHREGLTGSGLRGKGSWTMRGPRPLSRNLKASIWVTRCLVYAKPRSNE